MKWRFINGKNLHDDVTSEETDLFGNATNLNLKAATFMNAVKMQNKFSFCHSEGIP